MQRRYQEPNAEEQQFLQSKEFAKTALFFNNPYPRSFNGNSWDAKHMTSFLRKSNYSNWKGETANISRMSEGGHTRSYSSTQGDHFFKTTKDNKNQSKIGFTPLFPLVTNVPVSEVKQVTLNEFFKSNKVKGPGDSMVSGRSMKLRSNPEETFHFEGNAVKYKQTDPLTCRHEPEVMETVNGFKKERMSRLISCRHPHGMTGIDHPENSQSKYYSVYDEKLRVREEPNSHRTFLLDREWKEKKHFKRPVDEWKSRKSVTIRQFRNENTHGYNILNNRKAD